MQSESHESPGSHESHEPCELPSSFTVCECCGTLNNYGWTMGIKTTVAKELIGNEAFLTTPITLLLMTNGKAVHRCLLTTRRPGMPEPSVN